MVNRFQVTALANLSFDLAKVRLAGGLMCVMVGLYIGKEVKD